MSTVHSSSFVTGSAPSYHPTQQAEVALWNKGKLLPKASLPPTEAKVLLADMQRIEAVVAKAFEELESYADEILFGHAQEARYAVYAEGLASARRLLFQEAAHLEGPLGIYNKLATVKELPELPELIERVQSVSILLVLALTTTIDLDAICGKKYGEELAFFSERVAKLFGSEAVSSLSEIKEACDIFAQELQVRHSDPTKNPLEQHKLDVRKVLYSLFITLTLYAVEDGSRDMYTAFIEPLKEYLRRFSEEDKSFEQPLAEEEVDVGDVKLRKWYAFLNNKSRGGKPSREAKEISQHLESRVAAGLSAQLKAACDIVKNLSGPSRQPIDLGWNKRYIARLKVTLEKEFKRLKDVPDDPLVFRIVQYAYGLLSGIENVEAQVGLADSFTTQKADIHFQFLKTLSDFIRNKEGSSEQEIVERVYTLLIQFGRADLFIEEHEKVQMVYRYVESLSQEPRDESVKGLAAKFFWHTQEYVREILAAKVPEFLKPTQEEELATSELIRGICRYEQRQVQDALPNHVVSSLLKRIVKVLFLKTDTPKDMETSLELYQIKKKFGAKFETTLEWFPVAKRIFQAYANPITDEGMLEHALRVGKCAFESESFLSYVEAWHHYFAFQKRYGEEKTLLKWLDEARSKYDYPKVSEAAITSDIRTWESITHDADSYFLRLLGACLYGEKIEEEDAQNRLSAFLREQRYDLSPFIQKLILENAIKKLCITSQVELSSLERELVDGADTGTMRLQLAKHRLNLQLDPKILRDIEAISNQRAGGRDDEHF